VSAKRDFETMSRARADSSVEEQTHRRTVFYVPYGHTTSIEICVIAGAAVEQSDNITGMLVPSAGYRSVCNFDYVHNNIGVQTNNGERSSACNCDGLI